MYQPSQEILDRYAKVLIDYALNSGDGIKSGDVVLCMVPDIAKPLAQSLHKVILKSGGHPMIRLMMTGSDLDFYQLADQDQLTFFPDKYIKSQIDLVDHTVGIIAEHDLHELQDVDPDKLMAAAESRKQARIWRNEKEYAGKLTWTLAMYGTPAMAKEAKMTEKEYWQQIINACFLDYQDPISKWNRVQEKQEKIKSYLNNLPIETLRIEAKDTDLTINLGEKRRFIGGSGRNIPSFEIFTSPDWRGAEGHIWFNQPLYRYGNLIKDIRLTFKDGLVVEAKASKGQKLLEKLINRPDANKIGEFSLTEGKMSRITKFMANTLFDENIGGEFGNTHIAVGMSYKDCYDGDPRNVSKKEWKRLGFNPDAGEHCDIISTTDRKVTARLSDGSSKLIYADGAFVLN